MPRTYNCCYCKQKFNRHKLPKHMEKHADEIPENLTPYQVAYDIINNHPNHKGVCVICGSDCGWNERTQKYHRICRDKRCAEAIKKTYQERMMKVYNKPHLMDDVNHLEKMLAHRKISGKYKWSDGTEFTYTGSYEKNFLEFLDKVMNYDSREIISPGPVLEYDYKGKKHKWITDVMILPYNLIVEIKDGGDNKNGNQAWKGTRDKTIAKEVMITNLGKYNYIRLTNNDFAQFLGIIAELKMQIVDDTVSPLYRIHEDTSLNEESLPEAIDNQYSLLEENDLDKELEYLHEGFLDTIKGLTPSTQRAIENIKAPLKAMVTGEHNGKKLDNVTRFIGASEDALTSAVIYLPAGVLLDALLLITIGWLKFLTRNEKEIKPEDLPKIKQQILKIQSSMQKCKTTSNHKRYNDLYWKLEFLKGKYNACAKANGIKPLPVKGPIKEDSLPEAIDNPYMLREAQEWEHLTHMWDNAIDDIIGNVTNSPFEVNKGSYIDHDPETGKEVCVMRTIRPKTELKNREYRDRLKRQMYKLQQKINKAYNVHPSVMFIQYPIDNTNLTEGLIIGITKTS